ncbi:MAG: BACON domain-containing protein [Reichenbachiella sp.]
MMRLFGLLLLLFITSCSEETTEIMEDFLEISQDTLIADSKGEIIRMDIQSNKVWSVTDTSSWLMGQKDTTDLNNQLVVTIVENPNESPRDSYLFLYVGSIEKRIYIHQNPFIHPANQPLDLGPQHIEVGNEHFDTLIHQSNLMIAEIQACGENPGSNSHNIVLLDAQTSQISVTWNHITSSIGEWAGISQTPTAYNLSDHMILHAEACNSAPTYEAILVKKYGDWEHQHANGFFLNPKEQNVYMFGIDKIVFDFYYDTKLSRIPNKEEIANAYAMDINKVSDWDQGILNFDIQLHTHENTLAAYNLALDPSFGDKWLRIEISTSALEYKSNGGQKLTGRKSRDINLKTLASQLKQGTDWSIETLTVKDLMRTHPNYLKKLQSV